MVQPGKTRLPLLLLLTFVVAAVLARDPERACRTSADCLGPNEDCLNGICHCQPEALSWDGGDCLTKRQFGEPCADSNQCLMSGDPHMDCLPVSSPQAPPRPRLWPSWNQFGDQSRLVPL